MKYFFILGNNVSLSVAEIVAVIPDFLSLEILEKNVLILDAEKDINEAEIIKRLGGTIKIGKICGDVKRFNKDELISKVSKMISPGDGKFCFGISYYGDTKLNIRVLGMELKKFLVKRGVSCRWVVSREKTLSSVVVEQNKLTTRGAEIVIIPRHNDLLIGKTGAVQDFKSLSFRDFDRPARDSLSGMLPPKLAQIMINLATRGRKDIVLLDPFCGSGTILMEAMLFGAKQAIGSDISAKAIADTEENTEWVKNKFNCGNFDYQLFKKSATEISRVVAQNSVDVIVTEPYLGPQRGDSADIYRVKKELSDLYGEAIAEFRKVLKKDGLVVMLWPCLTKKFTSKNNRLIFMDPQFNGFEIVPPLPEEIINHPAVKISPRQTLIYGREGQRVWREVVILKRKGR